MVIAFIQALLFSFGIIQYLIANSKRRVNPQEVEASIFLLQYLTTLFIAISSIARYSTKAILAPSKGGKAA